MHVSGRPYRPVHLLRKDNTTCNRILPNIKECDGMTNEHKIAIVGVGPVGGILGAFLSRAGHKVVLCDVLKGHLDAIRERGLKVFGVSEMTFKSDRLIQSVAELAEYPHIDTIVIATKASVMSQFIDEVKRVAGPGTRIISCQNGLDNEEYLAEIFGADNVLRMVVNFAGSLVKDGQIRMTFFNPPNYVGTLTKQAEQAGWQLAELLSSVECETRFTPDIKRFEWEKVIVNAGLSAMCALTCKRMKDMMDFEPTELLVEELMREGIEVAQACGVTFEEDLFERCVRYLRKAGYHKTSMHHDIERGLPTEIDWLNGKIVERGKRVGIDTPYNYAITALVKGLELKSAAPEGH